MNRAIDSILKGSTIESIQAATLGTCQLLDPAVELTDARELAMEQLEMLKHLLLDAESWFFAAKRCLPSKVIARFRLNSPKRTVLVTLDMACLGWIISAPREKTGGFFDPVQAEIRSLLKTVFVDYASPNPRSLWRSGVIANLRGKRI